MPCNVDSRPAIQIERTDNSTFLLKNNVDYYFDINDKLRTVSTLNCSMTVVMTILDSDNNLFTKAVNNVTCIWVSSTSKVGFSGIMRNTDDKNITFDNVMSFKVKMNNIEKPSKNPKELVVLQSNGDVVSYGDFKPINMNTEFILFTSVNKEGQTEQFYIPMKSIDKYKIVEN